MTRDPPVPAVNNHDSPFPLTDVDRAVLSQTDQEFKRHDWNELKEIIQTNSLQLLKRTPSDLRRYMKWTRETKEEYGSMTSYILQKRLPQSWGGPPFTPASTVPLQDSSDYRVLLNDWPYGLESDVSHLVVWSRALIPVDDIRGDVNPESRALIEDFVKRHFADELEGDDRVIWFKNWVSLQSVRSLEHFHVLVRGADDATIERWTGDNPSKIRQRRLKIS